MADANPNPDAGTPTPADLDLETEILDVLALGDTKAAADAIANKSAEPPAEGASSPKPSQAGEAPAAPGASPVTPSPAPSEAAPTPAAPEPAPAPASAAPAAPSPAPATPDAAPQPPAVDEAALRTASLEAQVTALTEELNRLRASPQPAPTAPVPTGQPAPTAAPESGQPAAEQLYRYNLTLPPPVIEALQSDDPQTFAQGIGTIVNDLGTIVHNTVVAQVRGEFRATLQQLMSSAEQAGSVEERESARKAAAEDYYKDFPAHNNPLILPILQAESQKMAAEFPGLSWNPQYKAALGARVNAALEALSAPVGQQPEAEPAPVTPGMPPPPKPAAMLPSGARAASPGASGDISEEIVGVLSPFSG